MLSAAPSQLLVSCDHPALQSQLLDASLGPGLQYACRLVLYPCLL